MAIFETLYKNIAGQKLAIEAFSPPTVPVTGDAANITAQISKDGGASAATNDVNPTELDATNHPGIYIFDLTQAETDADLIVVTVTSTTPNVTIESRRIRTLPGTFYIAADTIVRGVVDDSNFASTVIEFETNVTEATADHYVRGSKGRRIIFTTGALKDQATEIDAYELLAGLGHFTVLALTEAPANGDEFIIV